MDLKSKRSAGSGLLAISIALFMTASSANAATLNVVGQQLLGASGVEVGGQLYDVEFIDGTCIAVFSGCDSASDFTFTTDVDAVAATQALLDQVFVDVGLGNFGSEPQLTHGCEQLTQCLATTASGIGFAVVIVRSANNFIDGGVVNFEGSFQTSLDTSQYPNIVFAVWTPVPEPGTAVLMGFGLTALAARRKV